MKDSKTASYLYEKYKEYKFHKKIKGYDFLMKTNKKYTQTLIGVVAVHSKTAEEKEKSINVIRNGLLLAVSGSLDRVIYVVQLFFANIC